ncbi:MAG: OmpA family protein [Proteobacteria bacterium]|nr:OmpA family protein [Pseudomonadota bacterium]
MVRTSAFSILFTLALCTLLGCAATPVTPVAVAPLAPGSGEAIVVDQAVILVDSSGSISPSEQFPGEKALLQSFVSGMPEGGYEVGAIAFGGLKRDSQPLARFDRAALAAYADGVEPLSDGTPIDRVLEEVRDQLAGQQQRAAVVLFSDGRPSDLIGRPVEEALTLEAAAALAADYAGQVCFHTVQIGSDPEGAVFLQRLAGTTECGSYRTASVLATAAAVEDLERTIFLGSAPSLPAVGAAPPDLRCSTTPLGSGGGSDCWRLDWLHFDTDSAELRPEEERRLREEVLPVLSQNPDLRIVVGGHADARGTERHNQGLSERRAQAVRDFLAAAGIAADRLQVRGFGESAPIAPNDSEANWQRNRRSEISVDR